jgi:hypothetical protein
VTVAVRQMYNRAHEALERGCDRGGLADVAASWLSFSGCCTLPGRLGLTMCSGDVSTAGCLICRYSIVEAIFSRV